MDKKMVQRQNASYEKSGTRQKQIDFSLIYPVGSIYMSVNQVNPSELFGGTWEQIKEDTEPIINNMSPYLTVYMWQRIA